MSFHDHITEISDSVIYVGNLVSTKEKNPLLWHVDELLFSRGTMADGVSG